MLQSTNKDKRELTQTLNSRPSCLENASQFWQAFPSLALFRYFSAFCSNLISKPISTSLTLCTAEVYRDGLSMDASDSTPPVPCWSKMCLFKLLPPQTELKLLGTTTGACDHLPLQPPRVQLQHHSLPVT